MAKIKRSQKSIASRRLERQKYWALEYSKQEYGIGVQCTKCQKWRHAYEWSEPKDVPEDFDCSMMQIGKQKGSCDIDSKLTEESFPSYKFVPGMVVFAKYGSHTWWPGIIEDHPDEDNFVRETNGRRNSLEYNVTFFGKKLTQGWVKEKNLRSFGDSTPKPTTKRYQKKIAAAIEQAKEALKVSIKVRLLKYGMCSTFTNNCQVDSDVPSHDSERKSQVCNTSHTSSKLKITSNEDSVSSFSSLAILEFNNATSLSAEFLKENSNSNSHPEKLSNDEVFQSLVDEYVKKKNSLNNAETPEPKENSNSLTKDHEPISKVTDTTQCSPDMSLVEPMNMEDPLPGIDTSFVTDYSSRPSSPEDDESKSDVELDTTPYFLEMSIVEPMSKKNSLYEMNNSEFIETSSSHLLSKVYEPKEFSVSRQFILDEPVVEYDNPKYKSYTYYKVNYV